MISVNRGRREFHLATRNTSYVMKVSEEGHLLNLHYGPRLHARGGFPSLDRRFGTAIGNSTAYSERDETYILDALCLEFPTSGKGDYRENALGLRFEDGSSTCDLRYRYDKLLACKPHLQGLPQARAGNTIENYGSTSPTPLAGETLEICLADEAIDLEVSLFYSVFEEEDVIVRSVLLKNGLKGSVKIEKVMSASLDFRRDDFLMMSLDGKWIKEAELNARKPGPGVTMLDSKKGVSGSIHNPFVALSSPLADESHGEVYGFCLIYSGNHRETVEVSPYAMTRVQLGINPHEFGWTLKPGEVFQAPEAVLTYSSGGLGGMSRNLHALIRHRIVPTAWQGRERPILVNNWEATYFDFNEDRLLSLARQAKDLGIELFVLDDGWFGKRNDDRSSLGDWTENREKLPSGLGGLSAKIHELGMSFGLWVEPEMVSPESDLFRRHPDWAIRQDMREASLGRHQLILDLANPEVVDYLYETLSALFARAKVEYVKWDMNRNFSDSYSKRLPADRQCEFCHRYALGLYGLIGRLTEGFPDILFESCSSGGNRFDLGMLYYMPQTWTSDDTDAVERYAIQYGTSVVYPPSTMGAHVSGMPSHQVLRSTPIETRFNVAAFGLLGYELDLTRLSPSDIEAVEAQIAFYKEHRQLLQFGSFYRLSSPFEGNHCSWMVVSEDKGEAILGYYQRLQEASPGLESIRLQGLDEDGYYDIEARVQFTDAERGLLAQAKEAYAAGGDELMYAGFRPMSQFMGTGLGEGMHFIGDFGSRIYRLKRRG